MDFQQKIIDSLKKQGVTVSDAAEKMGISRQTFYNYIDKIENGELSERLTFLFTQHFKFEEPLKKMILKKSDIKEMKHLNEMLELRIEGGFGIESNFFNGTIHDTKNIVALFTKGMPKQDYRVIEVESSFMAPTIEPGALIVCEQMPAGFINQPYNYFAYFIILQKQVYLTRVFKKQNGDWFLKMDSGQEIKDFDPSAIINFYIVRRIYNANDAAPKIFDVK